MEKSLARSKRMKFQNEISSCDIPSDFGNARSLIHSNDNLKSNAITKFNYTKNTMKQRSSIKVLAESNLSTNINKNGGQIEHDQITQERSITTTKEYHRGL